MENEADYKVSLNAKPEEQVTVDVEETNNELVENTKALDQDDSEPNEGVDSQEVDKPVIQEVEDTQDVVDQPDVSIAQEEKQIVTDDESVQVTENKVDVPESVDKLLKFMQETGGDINDYVRLNTDISKLDTTDVLDEYYKQTKPHLSSEERGFLLEETFSFDEEVDTDKDIKKKKIALKEEAAKAREYLSSQKDKYYNEIKASSNLTSDQKEAVDFYNKHKQDSVEQSKLTESSKKEFLRKTDTVFGDGFEGFEFNVSDKKFRYNVKNKSEVKANQSDLSNFVNKFVGEDNNIKDAVGYHKSLYAAMNTDALAQHFYEQGKADAIKQSVAQSKNINTEARQTHGETQVGGVKFKVLGDSANDFKFKIKSKR